MERLEKDKTEMKEYVKPRIFKDSCVMEDFLYFLVAIIGVIVLSYLYRIVEFLFF